MAIPPRKVSQPPTENDDNSVAAPPRKVSSSSTRNNDEGNMKAQVKKSLFVVSEDESGPPDFGGAVAEASGSKTGWAPKMKKRSTASIGNQTGGMSPKISTNNENIAPKKSASRNPQQQRQQQQQQPKPSRPTFGSTVSEMCPPLTTAGGAPTKRSSSPSAGARKQKLPETDLNLKLERNPAVNLVDGGLSKQPPKQTLRYSGSMMSPRTFSSRPPPPSGDVSSDDEEEKNPEEGSDNEASPVGENEEI